MKAQQHLREPFAPLNMLRIREDESSIVSPNLRLESSIN